MKLLWRRTIEVLRRQAHERRAQLVLAGIAFALYLVGIGWGLPLGSRPDAVRPWGPDDITPLGPLAELRSVLAGQSAGGFLGYPLMHYMVLGAAYLPYLLWSLVTHGLTSPGAEYPYGFSDVERSLSTLTLIARSVSAMMAAGAVALAYEAGRALWDRREALLAAIFAMLLYPFFYYSRSGNLDMPALFWSALGLATYAWILREGYTSRRGVALAVAAALAAGTKDQSVGLFLGAGVAVLPLSLRRANWKALLAMVTVGLLVYAVTSGFLLSPARYFGHIAFILGGGKTVYPGEEASIAGYVALGIRVVRLLIDSMTPLMLLFALGGVVAAAASDRRALAMLLPVAGLFAIVVLPTRYVEMRFLLPVALIFCLFAARATVMLQARLPAAHWLIPVALCLWPAAHAADLTWAMLRDSRYETAAWIDRQVRPGEVVGYTGPDQKLPRVRPDIQMKRVIPFSGTNRRVRYSPADIDAMARALADSDASFVLVMPDHSSTAEYPWGTTLPPAVYDRLASGTLGYSLAATIETPGLLPWQRPDLDYPSVSPPVRIFIRTTK